VVFNGGTARNWLIAALVLAVVSIGSGLTAVILRSAWLAGAAVVALVVSLVFGVFAASSAFSDGGRPTLSKVSVISDGDTHAILSFFVAVDGVKKDNLFRAFALWIPDTKTLPPGQTPLQEPPFYIATLRPNDQGVVSQEVSILLERPSSAQKIRLQVYWDTEASKDEEASEEPTPTAEPTPTLGAGIIPTQRPPVIPQPVGALCGNQAQASVAAACVEVQVEPAVTPTPTPT